MSSTSQKLLLSLMTTTIVCPSTSLADIKSNERHSIIERSTYNYSLPLYFNEDKVIYKNKIPMTETVADFENLRLMASGKIRNKYKQNNNKSFAILTIEKNKNDLIFQSKTSNPTMFVKQKCNLLSKQIDEINKLMNNAIEIKPNNIYVKFNNGKQFNSIKLSDFQKSQVCLRLSKSLSKNEILMPKYLNVRQTVEMVTFK